MHDILRPPNLEKQTPAQLVTPVCFRYLRDRLFGGDSDFHDIVKDRLVRQLPL